MKEENFIHIKLDYGEALQSKKDILFSEIDLLRILKILRKYHSLRSKEIEMKEEYQKGLRELLNNLRKTESLLPTIKIPKVLKQEREVKEKIVIQKTKPVKEEPDEIELQLQQIQDKLRSLEQ
jgi:hypothetical protein